MGGKDISSFEGASQHGGEAEIVRSSAELDRFAAWCAKSKGAGWRRLSLRRILSLHPVTLERGRPCRLRALHPQPNCHV
jgi:hypothetical protein